MLIVQTKSIIYDLIELTSAESNTTYDEITGGNILKKIVFLFFSCIFILMLTGFNYVSSEKEGKRIDFFVNYETILNSWRWATPVLINETSYFDKDFGQFLFGMNKEFVMKENEGEVLFEIRDINE